MHDVGVAELPEEQRPVRQLRDDRPDVFDLQQARKPAPAPGYAPKTTSPGAPCRGANGGPGA